MIDERRIHGSGETVHTAEEMRLTTENSRLREALERGWQLVVLLRHAAGIHGSAPPSHLLVPLIRLFDWDTELANDELFRDLGHRALASPPPTPVTGALNQCDGCVAGMPVKDGRHTFPEGSWSGMRCTKDRYQPAPTPVVGTGPVRLTCEEYRIEYGTTDGGHCPACDPVDCEGCKEHGESWCRQHGMCRCQVDGADCPIHGQLAPVQDTGRASLKRRRSKPAPTPVVGTGPADITEDLNIIADLIQQELSPVSHVAAAGRLRYAADLIRILRGNFTSGLDNLSDPR